MGGSRPERSGKGLDTVVLLIRHQFHQGPFLKGWLISEQFIRIAYHANILRMWANVCIQLGPSGSPEIKEPAPWRIQGAPQSLCPLHRTGGGTPTAPPEADHLSQLRALLPPPHWGLNIGKVLI